MNKIKLKFKSFIKIILGKELYFKKQINIKTKLFGNIGAGFYVDTNKLSSSSIIYSFGVGEDISFDLQLINEFNCQIFAFDPTPKSIEFVSKNRIDNFNFYPFGLLNYDGNVTFYMPENSNNVSCTTFATSSGKKISVPVKKFETIIKSLNHKKIALLKLDIEGSEYDVLNDILNSKVEIAQILIEFHHRFKQIGFEKTKYAIKTLNQYGYKIAKISESREEYTFIKF